MFTPSHFPTAGLPDRQIEATSGEWRRPLLRLLGCLLFVFHCSLDAQPAAAQSGETGQQISALRKTVTAAGSLFRTRKYEQAANEVARARQLIAALEDAELSTSLQRQIRGLSTRIERLAEQLAGQDVEIPDEPAPSDDDMPPGDAAGPSFASEVAPILVRRCGGCHVNRMRGNFSMATFAALARGADGSPVVVRGQPDESRIVQVIADGDMPRGGGRVPPAELDTIAGWIAAGARFDGEDAGTPLAELAAAADPDPAPMLEINMPTGDETVSFAADVAPVFVEECLGCHGMRTSGGLSLANFQTLLRGGGSGATLDLESPADSLLVQKLRGTAGARMPLQRPPLDDEVIAKIETWISEGATFDGPDPNQPLLQLVRTFAVQNMNHEQLAAEREELASSNWRLASPSREPATHATENFLLLGRLGSEQLEAIAAAAETQHAAISRLLRLPADEPLFKGRLTIYAFERRYDYGELGRMVEKRELPAEWDGHWRFNILDAYACLLLPRRSEDAYELKLSELIAGAYIDSRGTVPAWFSYGSARAIASRALPRDAQVAQWDRELKDRAAGLSGSDDLLAGRLPEGELALLGYGLADFLMSDLGRYTRLLQLLADGQEFDAALAESYGAPAPDLAQTWLARASRRR